MLPGAGRPPARVRRRGQDVAGMAQVVEVDLGSSHRTREPMSDHDQGRRKGAWRRR
jgi:hypothetical protein